MVGGEGFVFFGDLNQKENPARPKPHGENNMKQ